MGRIQQPRELAELKGAVKHDPQRYKADVPKNPSPVGQPPAHMGESAKAIWFELEAYALPGVLTASDRFMLEFIANFLVEYRSDPADFTAAKMGNLISCCARLGFSAADRQKLGVAKKKPESGFEMF